MKALIAILLIVSLPALAGDVRCKKFPSTEPGPIVMFPDMCPIGWQPA
jgi:hypothetical protein